MVRFQWAPGHIFPVYPLTSGSHASQRRVNKLKPVAVAILTEEAAKVRRAFQTLARGRGKGIQLDLDAACVKIENARISPESGGLHGESDGDTIWISKNKINDAELLGVLYCTNHYTTAVRWTAAIFVKKTSTASCAHWETTASSRQRLPSTRCATASCSA